MQDQEQNQVFTRQIVFGSIATYLGNKKIGDSTHEWICYVRGVNNENISYFVEKVVFVLHSSFQDTNRVVTTYPYVIKEKGWGQFDIQIKIYLKGQYESPLIMNHPLKLYTSNNQNAQPSKKPVVYEAQDEVVFVNPKGEVLASLQEQQISSPIIQNLQDRQQMDEEGENQGEENMSASQYYQHMKHHFTQFDEKEHKQKLESAIQFLSQEMIIEHYKKNRQLDEDIQSLEFEVLQLQSQLGVNQ